MNKNQNISLLFNVYLIILPILSGLISKILINRIHEKEKNEFNIAIENLKSDLAIFKEKHTFIHKLQFEKEFEIYTILWEKLFELKYELDDIKDFKDLENYKFFSKNEKIEKCCKLHINIQNLFNKNKPFYNKEIYENIEKLLKICNEELALFSIAKSEEDIKNYMNSFENINKLKKQIDEICKSIQKRINL